MKLTHAPIVVSDQDEALRFYTEVLGFEKRGLPAAGPPALADRRSKGHTLEFILVQGQSKWISA